MPMMQRILVIVVCLLLLNVSQAHDEGVATLKLVRSSSNAWFYELHAPLAGLDKSMRLFAQRNLIDIDDLESGSKQYKELLVKYVKSTFSVKAEPVQRLRASAETQTLEPELGEGKIKLDSHSTVLIFSVKNMPQSAKRLVATIALMSQNSKQQNVLTLVDGVRSERYVLNSSNQFSVVIEGF